MSRKKETFENSRKKGKTKEEHWENFDELFDFLEKKGDKLMEEINNIGINIQIPEDEDLAEVQLPSSYSDYLDISLVDKFIHCMYVKNVKELDNKIKNIENKVNFGEMSSGKQRLLTVKKKYEGERERAVSLFEKYKEKTEEFLKQFKDSPQTHELKFGDKSTYKRPEKFTNIIDRYMKIADQFYDLGITKVSKEKVRCKCGEIFDEDNQYCQICGSEIQSIMDDIEIVPQNVLQKISQDTQGFEEEFVEYAGCSAVKLPTDLMTSLKSYMKENKISFKSIDMKNRMNQIRMRETIKEILESTNNKKYIKHLNLICNLMGMPLPNIMKFKQGVMERYAMYSAVYPTVRCSERESFLPKKYMLCRLLQMEGYLCLLPEFLISKNEKNIMFYDSELHKLCRELRWEFPRDAKFD